VNTIAFSAPGKALICGEYAVLRGAPAVSMAVSRRAVVTTRQVEADCYTVTTPGFAEGDYRFTVDTTGHVDWLDRPPDDGIPIIDAVFAQSGGAGSSPLELSIDTRSFVDSRSGEKLGLGSSAAATVALTSAIHGGVARSADVFDAALAAHRQFQGGQGSGVDVATSCLGGVVVYRQGEEPLPVAWADALQVRFFYSGRPASTTAAIRRLAGADDDGKAWSRLNCAAEDAANSLRSDSAVQVLDAISDYADALQSFDEAHRLGIYSAGHDAIAALARDCGVVYKPCGAGGGDIGVALAVSIADIETFTALAVESGFRYLELQRDDRGVSRDSGDND
jgi:phosphomevalonate kinase